MKSRVASHRVGIVFGPSSTASVNPYLTPLQGSNSLVNFTVCIKKCAISAGSLCFDNCAVMSPNTLQNIRP